MSDFEISVNDAFFASTAVINILAADAGIELTSDSNRNTLAGTDAGNGITNGTDNTVFGYNTGASISSGIGNSYFR